MAKAQGAITAPERNKTVTVTPRSGGRGYSFKYATLSAVIEAIRKAFSENDLWFTQVIGYDAAGRYYTIRTMLLHGSGQFIASEVPIIVEEATTNQQFGSALTYMKRYALCALIGIAAEEDDDGNIADGNEVTASQETQKPKTVAQNPIKEPEQIVSTETSIGRIEVPFDPETEIHDWITWGRRYVEAAKSCKTMQELEKLEAANSMPLTNMETQVPKMFTNMRLTVVQCRQKLEGKKS